MAQQIQQQYPEVYAICQQFELTEAKMNEIVHRLTKEINMGLAKDTHPRSTVKCFVTFVQELPTGKERGKFLALDLGGTNFRVLLVNLKSESDIDIASQSFVISKALQEGPGKNLFDFIAESLALFCREHKMEKDNAPLGFTFSFPCKQVGIDNGILVAWTKGFKCDGVVGKNVVELLREAISRRNDLKVKIVALLNDTTGTLMSCAFMQRNCRIGTIVGTGCNACYVEKTSNAETFDGYQTSNKPNMIINCEWGAFGDNGVLDFIRTSYDKVIDLQSVNARRQVFEKCTAGMYMGEIVRLILVELIDKGILFKGTNSQVLHEKWKFDTRFITEIESDSPGQYRNASLVMDQMGIRSSNDRDLACVRLICESVSTRSAKLVACGHVALINRMNVKDLAIGVDGSVIRFHPHYQRKLAENMTLLLKGSAKFELVLSEDGSGRGAALIAAVSNK